MIREILKFAVKNRENIIEIMSDTDFTHYITKAKMNWVHYTPNPHNNRPDIIAIDSSYNNVKFQGLELWVVDVIAINISGEIKSKYFDIGLTSENVELASISSYFEISALKQVLSDSNIILMDGSLHTHFINKKTPLNLIKQVAKHNVIFISKTSYSKNQINGVAGDIFYYTKASRMLGFSKPFTYSTRGEFITSSFVRISEDTPLLKIELLGKSYTQQDIKDIMNLICTETVGGYPRSLKLAHNECKISNKDMRMLVSMLGLSNETGARELLG